MTGTVHPPTPEERLRAFLLSEAEHAMTQTDTQAELSRFRDTIHKSRTGRRTAWLAAAAAAAVVATAVSAGLLATGPGRPQTVDVAGTLEAPTPLPSSLVQGEIPMSGPFGEAAFPAGGALWRLASENTVDRIDPESGQVTVVPLTVTAAEPFVEAGGLVWFPGSDKDGERLFALDPATNEIALQTEDLGTARFVGSGPAGLWAVTGLRELTEVDPASGAVLRTVQTEQGLYDVHVGDGVVYTGSYVSGTGITVVDTTTGASRIVLPRVPTGPITLTAEGDVWVHDLARGALARYDTTTFEQEAAIELGLPTSRGAQREWIWSEEYGRMRTTEGWINNVSAYPVVVGDSLYATYTIDGSTRLLRADVVTGEIAGVVELAEGSTVGPVTSADDSLWVGWRGADAVRRIALFQ